ncbi:unnamed protein product [Dicrocoelium dendriticum]|nr:unnamed protein product [Dicrocoelium dendriticum]
MWVPFLFRLLLWLPDGQIKSGVQEQWWTSFVLGNVISLSPFLPNASTPIMSVGIPIKVLHDAEGHVTTVETRDGETFRGKLIEAEDNMNIHMSDVIMTARDGRTSNLQQIYIRGSKIRFLILPDMLKNSPMLKRPLSAKGLGTGRGKNAMIRAGVRGRARVIGRGRVGTSTTAPVAAAVPAAGRGLGRF